MDFIKKPPLCIWLTGMPASGKSTLAGFLFEELSRIYPATHLESDVLRKKITIEAPYSEAGKTRFYRHVVEKAVQLGNTDKIPIIDATGQRRIFREQAKRQFKSVLEIYIYCPAEVRSNRDPKGLYHKCASGEVPNLPIYPVGDVQKPQFISHREDRVYIERFYSNPGIYEVPDTPSYVYFGKSDNPLASARKIVSDLVHGVTVLDKKCRR